MARFVLPKSAQASNWVRSTDALRRHLLARKTSISSRATALRRQAEEVEREGEGIDGAIALLDQMLPPRPTALPAPIQVQGAEVATAAKRWSPMHDACVGCGRNSVKHMARGLCASCYQNQAKERAAAAS